MSKDNFDLQGEKQYGNEFLSSHKNVIIFSRIATTSPFIIFPLLSFYFHDWWLLLGILFSYIGGTLSLKQIWIIIVIVLTIIYSFKFGFIWNSYVNIFFLFYLYGHITFTLSRYFSIKFEKTKSNIKNQLDNQVNQMLDDNKTMNSEF